MQRLPFVPFPRKKTDIFLINFRGVLCKFRGGDVPCYWSISVCLADIRSFDRGLFVPSYVILSVRSFSTFVRSFRGHSFSHMVCAFIHCFKPRASLRACNCLLINSQMTKPIVKSESKRSKHLLLSGLNHYVKDGKQQ